MGLLTDNTARVGMEDAAGSMYERMMGMLPGMQAQYGALQDATLAPFEREEETLRTKRGFRDPLKEFALEQGFREEAAAGESRARMASGLGGAAQFQAADRSLQARARGTQMFIQSRAQEQQRNSQALQQIISQQGQIRGNMGMAQIQATSGIQSQAIMGHAQMMSQAAQMANQPTFMSGLLGGVASGLAGGMFGAGAGAFFGEGGFFNKG